MLEVDAARVPPEDVRVARADLRACPDADRLGDEHHGMTDADVDREREAAPVAPIQVAEVDHQLTGAEPVPRRQELRPGGGVTPLPEAAVQ